MSTVGVKRLNYLQCSCDADLVSVAHVLRRRFVHDERVRAVFVPDKYPPAGIPRDDVTAESESHWRHHIGNVVNLKDKYNGWLIYKY